MSLLPAYDASTLHAITVPVARPRASLVGRILPQRTADLNLHRRARLVAPPRDGVPPWHHDAAAVGAAAVGEVPACVTRACEECWPQWRRATHDAPALPTSHTPLPAEECVRQFRSMCDSVNATPGASYCAAARRVAQGGAGGGDAAE
jgi:hypothetical protein